MNISKRNFDLTSCINRTFANKQRLTKYAEIILDINKKERIDNQECKICFYLPSVGGCAITTSYCSICEKELIFPNTNVDILCLGCAQEKRVCKHCGADINDKLRKKL